MMKRTLSFVLVGLLALTTASISCSQSPIKIRVATSTTYPPFTYVDKQTGQIGGFDIDLMKAIVQHENLIVEFVRVEFKPLLEGMAQGKYDAAISNISITEERKKDMLFSEPYFVTGHVVTVQKDNVSIAGKDSLPGKVVGVEAGSTSAKDVHEMTGVIVKEYPDLGSAFDDLMNGKIDAAVSDNTIASSYVSSNPNKLKIAGERFTQENYGIAVAKNRPDLLTKINAGLEYVKSQGLLEQLSAKWLPQ